MLPSFVHNTDSLKKIVFNIHDMFNPVQFRVNNNS